MPSKLFLIASTLFLGVLGIGGSFAPTESLALAGVEPSVEVSFIFQMMGGLYLGFAMLNWMNRNAPVGGIYGRPLLTANLIHFLIVSLMLIKHVIDGAGNGLILLCVLYTSFAVGFGLLQFMDPTRKSVKTG
ncbi:MAG: hypothetical protein O3A57_11300 [Bacteroidetes bacterium]|nr:hypothetical protein [Bacteroidota bacterium]